MLCNENVLLPFQLLTLRHQNLNLTRYLAMVYTLTTDAWGLNLNDGLLIPSCLKKKGIEQLNENS